MIVTFKSDTVLGNRPFKKGQQIVSDHLNGNQKFKQLVKSGQIIIHPRDVGTIKIQKGKDALNAQKAEAHRQMGKVLTEARLTGIKPAEVTEIAVPGTQSGIQAKKDEKAKLVAIIAEQAKAK